MYVELLLDVHKVRRNGSVADAQPVGNITVGEAVDNVANGFAFAITDSFIKAPS